MIVLIFDIHSARKRIAFTFLLYVLFEPRKACITSGGTIHVARVLTIECIEFHRIH